MLKGNRIKPKYPNKDNFNNLLEIVHYYINDVRKIILLIIICSFISLSWMQSFIDNNFQKLINISDEEVMIVFNDELGSYNYSDTIYISTSRFLPPCDDGYTEIDSSCYYQSDLDVLQDFIDNSSETINMEMDVDSSGVIEPLELFFFTQGHEEDEVGQVWDEGRLIHLKCNTDEVGLSGQIPESIGNLTNLTVLRIGNTLCEGEIPNSIGNLTNLNDLGIWGNDLISGEIPESIGNLLELELLSIEDNNNIGVIPESIGNLTNLIFLDLEDNQLSGEIPESIWNLTNLIWLDLGDNQLVGEISDEISNLDSIMVMSLTDNQLSGEIPLSLWNMTTWIYIYLENNQLEGEIPDNIDMLNQLEELRLSDNNISGNIPESICNIFPNLDYFGIEGNKFCPPYPECLLGEEFIDENVNGIWDEDESFTDENENGWYDEEGVGYQDTSECVEYQLGDVNGDFEINISDIIIMVDIIINEGEYNEYGDINGDGYLNILDILILVQVILTQP